MWSSANPFKRAALTLLAFAAITTPATSVVQKGKGTVHGDLHSSTTEWPSLKLHFTLKRGTMQVYGQAEFDIYANPVVSKDGLSVVYDGYVDFTQDSTLTRYLFVDGIAYSTTSFEVGQAQTSSSECLPTKMLPPLNDMLPALNDVIPVSNGTLDGAKIKCSVGNLFKTTFRGLNLAVCASGSSGVRVYGSDMDISVAYLKKRVEVTAPKLNASEASQCETVVNATAVTATSTALLTGEPIPESESRSLDFGSDVDVAASTCSCKSTPRSCLFIHGLGVDYAKEGLHDSFTDYWGNLADHSPCCTEYKYIIWNSWRLAGTMQPSSKPFAT